MNRERISSIFIIIIIIVNHSMLNKIITGKTRNNKIKDRVSGLISLEDVAKMKMTCDFNI